MLIYDIPRSSYIMTLHKSFEFVDNLDVVRYEMRRTWSKRGANFWVNQPHFQDTAPLEASPAGPHGKVSFTFVSFLGPSPHHHKYERRKKNKKRKESWVCSMWCYRNTLWSVNVGISVTLNILSAPTNAFRIESRSDNFPWHMMMVAHPRKTRSSLDSCPFGLWSNWFVSTRFVFDVFRL